MKKALRRSFLIFGFTVVAIGFDAILLESRLLAEVTYRTARTVVDIEPGARQIIERLWLAE
jgi:hypothetical protein